MRPRVVKRGVSDFESIDEGNDYKNLFSIHLV